MASITNNMSTFTKVSLLTNTIWDVPKIRVPYFGVLIIRILLFRGLYWGVPYFRKRPYQSITTRDSKIHSPRLPPLRFGPPQLQRCRPLYFFFFFLGLGLGFRVQGLGFRVQGAGFRVSGSGFRV